MPATAHESPLAAAALRLERAEAELSLAIGELPISDRRDERIVTERLPRAMNEIVSARELLKTLLNESETDAAPRSPVPRIPS